MNRDEAKQVLFLYRPGTADAEDPEIVAAMEVARQDPELGRWFNQHAEFQKAMRAKLRHIEVPTHLKGALLAKDKIVRPAVWWSRPAVLPIAAAAALALFLGLAVVWFKTASGNQFANFQERMVSEVQRQYVMEWTTSDMSQLRQSIASRGGQSDYEVPSGLRDLKLTGGGVLRWHTNPVSMVCFDRGGGQMLFLFVMKRQALNNPPSASGKPQLAVVHEWLTASWTKGDNSYVLAGQEEADLRTFARKYL